MRIGDKVRVYRNIRKGVWSVRIGKEKVRHVRELQLAHCRMVVSEAGRARCLERKQKGVHAYIDGIVGAPVMPEGERITYNPYRAGTFTVVSTGEEIHEAGAVYLAPDGTCYAALRCGICGCSRGEDAVCDSCCEEASRLNYI